MKQLLHTHEGYKNSSSVSVLPRGDEHYKYGLLQLEPLKARGRHDSNPHAAINIKKLSKYDNKTIDVRS